MRRRVKPAHKDKSEEKEKFENTRNRTREELNFQFDEELDSPPPTGRHNAFTEWSVNMEIRITNIIFSIHDNIFF